MTDLRQIQGIRVVVEAARGPSTADLARRTGAYDMAPGDSDDEFMDRFAEYAIERNPGFRSNIPGPANSTYPSASAIRTTAQPTNMSAILAANGRRDIYVWVANGSGTGVVDVDYITSTVATGVWKRFDAPLYAGNFGVVGNGVVDDSNAAQAFLDLCQSAGRTASFGGMALRTTKALRANNTGVVFSGWFAAGKPPGIYPEGSGYTALTVVGAVTDFCVTVYGSGSITYGQDGTVTSDTRTKCHGIQFGEMSSGSAFSKSVVRHAGAYNLAGCGVRQQITWDSTFLSIAVEHCGLRGSGGSYAWSVEDSGPLNCNETTWKRVQVELSDSRAIYIAPTTLSCTFEKIHSERAYGEPGVVTWQFGPGVYLPTRLTATNPTRASILFVGQAGSFTGLRAEGQIRVKVDSTGGAVEFHASEGTWFEPNPGSGGAVKISGGMAFLPNLTSGWEVVGGIHSMSVGFCNPDQPVRVTGATLTQLLATNVNALAVVENCEIGQLYGWTGGQLRLVSGSYAKLLNNAQTFVNNKLWVDQSSVVVGNLTLNSSGAWIDGRIAGNLTVTGPRAIVWGSSAVLTGTATNAAGPPESGDYLDGLFEGMLTKNIRPAVAGTSGAQYLIQSWSYAGGSWRECRTLTGA